MGGVDDIMAQTVSFKMNEIYREEVSRLLSSRNKSKILHRSGDIDASGDEVEEPFRDFLRRRLPNKYYVGHGHIVDRNLTCSPQIDVIIADNSATPILFEGENGTQYFPYESVYAIGEVKSTYYNRGNVFKKWAATCETLANTLSREAAPPRYLGNGIHLSEMLTIGETRPLRNPLLSFVVCFDAGDANEVALRDELGGIADKFLPAISLFLDGSIVIKCGLKEVDGRATIDSMELDPIRVAESEDSYWMRCLFSGESHNDGQALGYFMLSLFRHLTNCVLMPPPLDDYLKNVIHQGTHSIETLSFEGMVKGMELENTPLPSEFVKEVKRLVAEGTPLSKALSQLTQK